MNVDMNMGINIKHKSITNVNTIEFIQWKYNMKIQSEEYLKRANFHLGRY